LLEQVAGVAYHAPHQYAGRLAEICPNNRGNGLAIRCEDHRLDLPFDNSLVLSGLQVPAPAGPLVLFLHHEPFPVRREAAIPNSPPVNPLDVEEFVPCCRVPDFQITSRLVCRYHPAVRRQTKRSHLAPLTRNLAPCDALVYIPQLHWAV